MNVNMHDSAFPATDDSTYGLSKFEYAVITFAAASLQGWPELPTWAEMERIAENSRQMAGFLFNELNKQP